MKRIIALAVVGFMAGFLTVVTLLGATHHPSRQTLVSNIGQVPIASHWGNGVKAHLRVVAPPAPTTTTTTVVRHTVPIMPVSNPAYNGRRCQECSTSTPITSTTTQPVVVVTVKYASGNCGQTSSYEAAQNHLPIITASWCVGGWVIPPPGPSSIPTTVDVRITTTTTPTTTVAPHAPLRGRCHQVRPGVRVCG